MAPAQTHLLLPLQHSPPQKKKNTFHPLLVERIPICPGAKFRRVSGNVVLGFCEAPLRRPRPRPGGAKSTTNYCGSILSFNPWQVPPGYYPRINGGDGAVWHSRDVWGFRGARLHEWGPGYISHPFDTTLCWIFISRHNHFGSKSLWNDKYRWLQHLGASGRSKAPSRTEKLTINHRLSTQFKSSSSYKQVWLHPLHSSCDTLLDTKGFFFFFLVSFLLNKLLHRRVGDTTFLPAQSSRHEKMSERPPEAALVWFTLICRDEPFWLWPGKHQAPPTLSSQSVMKKAQISHRGARILSPHIRQLYVEQQEAAAQIHVLKVTDHLDFL